MGSEEEEYATTTTNGSSNGHNGHHHHRQQHQHGSSSTSTSSSSHSGMTDHQKQGLILLLLSAIIYLACQFETPLDFIMIPTAEKVKKNKIEGPKPTTNIQMIALIGERNSGTRWTSEYVFDCVCVVDLCVFDCMTVCIP
jgi:hypothetical protein